MVLFLSIWLVNGDYVSKTWAQSQSFEYVELANISTGGDTFQVEVVGDLAYVIDMYTGLRIYNVSDPSNATLLGTFYDGGIPHELFIDGDLAYIADHYDGLEILNISDPSNPTEIGQITDTGDGEADGIFVANNRAYVAEWHDSTWSWKMIVIDVSDPANPVKLSEYVDEDGQFLRFYSTGDICYAACLDDGFKILNVSDSTDITEIGHYSDGGGSGNFQIVDTIAYVADGSDGLELIDVSDPANPVELGQYVGENYVFDVQIINDIAYIAEDETGLAILDISNPTAITRVGNYTTEDLVGVYVQGNYAYLAQHEYGLKIIKISTSSSTIETTSGWTILISLSALTVLLFLWRLKRRDKRIDNFFQR